MLLTPTGHKHLIYAGYSFTGTGSWMLKDGVFSFQDMVDLLQEKFVDNFLSSIKYGAFHVHIHCPSIGNWSASHLEFINSSRWIEIYLNPKEKCSQLEGADELLNLIRPRLKVLNIEEQLTTSPSFGKLQFDKPTLYIFPSGQGDCSLFGISNFTMLIDVGFNPVPNNWNFIRHLEKIDLLMITRLNENNILGLSSLFKLKAKKKVHPKIGHVFCNIRLSKSQTTSAPANERVIDVMHVVQKCIQDMKSIGLQAHSCFCESIPTPITLYHKIGQGTLDMIVLNPCKDTRLLNDFYKFWENEDDRLTYVQTISASLTGQDIYMPISDVMSICCLLIWKPANPNQKIIRILFPGGTPQSRILESVDRIKNLELLQHSMCTTTTLKSHSKSTKGSVKFNSTIFQKEYIKVPGEWDKEMVTKKSDKISDTNLALKKEKDIKKVKVKIDSDQGQDQMVKKSKNNSKSDLETDSLENEVVVQRNDKHEERPLSLFASSNNDSIFKTSLHLNKLTDEDSPSYILKQLKEYHERDKQKSYFKVVTISDKKNRNKETKTKIDESDLSKLKSVLIKESITKQDVPKQVNQGCLAYGSEIKANLPCHANDDIKSQKLTQEQNAEMIAEPVSSQDENEVSEKGHKKVQKDSDSIGQDQSSCPLSESQSESKHLCPILKSKLDTNNEMISVSQSDTLESQESFIAQEEGEELCKNLPKPYAQLWKNNKNTSSAKKGHTLRAIYVSPKGKWYYQNSKKPRKTEETKPVFVDLAYIPHNGDKHYCNWEYFTWIRARYYVLSAVSPSFEVLDGLLKAKMQWNDQDAEVTLIPTHETDTLFDWMMINQERLKKYKIDIAPSANRCSTSLENDNTMCSAYKIEL